MSELSYLPTPRLAQTAIEGQPTDSFDFWGMRSLFSSLTTSDMGWRVPALIGIGAILFIGSRWRQKNPLASARWANHAEKNNARKTAIQQLKERQHNKVTLYISGKQKPGRSPNLSLPFLTEPHDPQPSLYLPNAERGIAVVGSPGSGKTFSTIDPLLRSALELGHTVVLVDVKGEQTRRHAAYAAQLGYEIDFFAPGFPYSGCINPLDLLKDSADSVMARTIATLLNRNSRANASASRDDFFGPAAEQVLEAVLMLAKGSTCPDFLTAWKILSLPKLAKRLRAASEGKSLDLWAEVSATGIMSVADAERTVAGIVGNSVKTFSQFVKRDFLPCMVGNSTIPMELTGKRLLIFQIDEQREAVTAPLVAAILGATISRNMNNQVKRKAPLVLCIDEFPSLLLPELETWINRFREYGLVTILGYQNEAQLRKRYGPDDAASIIGACATKFVFNPSHEPTAKGWSEYMGQKELKIDPRSRTHGRNHSTSQSEQFHRIPLMESSSINQMSPGECVYINPAFQRRMRAEDGVMSHRSAPMHIPKMKISQLDLEIQRRSEELWDRKLRERLIGRAQKRAEKSGLKLEEQDLRRALQHRATVADWLLPSVEEKKLADKAQKQKSAA